MAVSRSLKTSARVAGVGLPLTAMIIAGITVAAPAQAQVSVSSSHSNSALPSTLVTPRSGHPASRGATLTAAEQRRIVGHSAHASGAPVSEVAMTRGFRGHMSTYAFNPAGDQPYGMLATGYGIAPSFKANKREYQKSANGFHLTYKHFNNRTKTGIVRGEETFRVPVESADGQTVDVVVRLVGVARVHDKKSSVAFVMSVENFGGSHHGAEKRADKAVKIIAKKNGMKI